MVVAEKELGRRLQLVQGIHWLRGAQGDRYAALLRGYDGAGPQEHYAALREAGPLWRSSLGTWVGVGYGVAAELLALPASGAAPPAVAWDADLPAPGPARGPDADRVRELAQQVCARLWAGLGGEADLVAEVAARVPAEVLAGLYGLTGGDRERLAGALSAASGALDAALAPPAYPEAVRLSATVAELSGLLGEGGVRQAVVRVRAARELLAGALGALVAAPREWALLVEQGRGRAARVVTETLRHDAPVKVHAFTAAATAEVAGQRIAAGDEVAVVVGAANRDPRVFEDPDVFAADRVLPDGARALVPAPYGIAPEPFGAAVAETVLVALAAARPGLRAAGPAVRSRRTPVTGGLLRLPVRL
ncbi:cytochrome P450 [Streptomyces albidoflavus]|uniref:cytochrome P450 family protein n=1 Tax=Streptomyces albidoflavus TaxID=1886 RepID=UPI0010220A6B|nr:cytochrome P450 [Streptomyces albidoflavus]RZF09684.1 P450-derived glycosyltransferase activator [Streptomyces albidoflavus]